MCCSVLSCHTSRLRVISHNTWCHTICDIYVKVCVCCNVLQRVVMSHVTVNVTCHTIQHVTQYVTYMWKYVCVAMCCSVLSCHVSRCTCHVTRYNMSHNMWHICENLCVLQCVAVCYRDTRCTTDFSENATFWKSTKSRNSNSSVQIQMKPKFQFEFVLRNTMKSEFLDLVEFGNVDFSVEIFISVYESCPAYEWVTSHVCISYITHTNSTRLSCDLFCSSMTVCPPCAMWVLCVQLWGGFG
jgi:hypothetical protein